jgi:hypothetical protein
MEPAEAGLHEARMHQGPDVRVIAQGGLSHLREIQQVLAGRGISAELVQPPKGQCGS